MCHKKEHRANNITRYLSKSSKQSKWSTTHGAPFIFAFSCSITVTRGHFPATSVRSHFDGMYLQGSYGVPLPGKASARALGLTIAFLIVLAIAACGAIGADAAVTSVNVNVCVLAFCGRGRHASGGISDQ